MELAAGGIAKEINASDVDRLLGEVTPATPVEQIRYDLAVDLLADIRRLDQQLKDSHRRIRQAVTASRTSLVEIYGIGPIIAATLIGYSGDIARFANRDAYAAYDGTAPVEFSSGGGSFTGCPSAATASSTTPCTWPPSARSARPTQRVGPTSSGASPKARPNEKRCAR